MSSPARRELSTTRIRIPVQLVATGAALPARVVDNAEVGRACGVDADWIRRRTGLRARRHASAGEASSDLGARAAARALERAGVPASDVGLVACATCTPDHAFPSTAALIASRLGASDTAAFDLQAGCAGFVHALVVGAQHVAAGLARHAVVIGVDVMSRLVDPHDRETATVFGDGAGAVVLGAAGHGREGIEGVHFGSDGGAASLLELPAGGSRLPTSEQTVRAGGHRLHMDGRPLYRRAIRHSVAAARRVLEDAGLGVEDVDLVVPHQSSARLLAAIARELGIERSRVLVQLEHHGNTASASLPIALDAAVEEGRVQLGGRTLLLGFGAGLTWGAALLRT